MWSKIKDCLLSFALILTVVKWFVKSSSFRYMIYGDIYKRVFLPLLNEAFVKSKMRAKLKLFYEKEIFQCLLSNAGEPVTH